jgi:hypothetical protein
MTRILSILLRFSNWHDIIEMFLPHPTDRRTALWGSIAGAPIGFFGGLLIAAFMAHGLQPQNAALHEGNLPSQPQTTVPQTKQSVSQPTLALNLGIHSPSASRAKVPTTPSSPVTTTKTTPSPIPTTGSEPSSLTPTSPPPKPQPSIQREEPTTESTTVSLDSLEKLEK